MIVTVSTDSVSSSPEMSFLGESAWNLNSSRTDTHVRDSASGEAIEGRDPLAAEFERLTYQWREDTAFLSFDHQIAQHWAYRAIVGMGEDALPLILRDLEETEDRWFSALTSITGEDPVAEQDRGRVPQMVQAWLQWGQEQGYI